MKHADELTVCLLYLPLKLPRHSRDRPTSDADEGAGECLLAWAVKSLTPVKWIRKMKRNVKTLQIYKIPLRESIPLSQNSHLDLNIQSLIDKTGCKNAKENSVAGDSVERTSASHVGTKFYYPLLFKHHFQTLNPIYNTHQLRHMHPEHDGLIVLRVQTPNSQLFSLLGRHTDNWS